MKRLWLVFMLVALTGCIDLPFPFGGSDDSGVTKRERDVSGTLAIALGGNTSGSDEIVFEGVTTLEFSNHDPDLFSIVPRDGFSDFVSGKGARVVPLREGIGYVTPTFNGRELSPIEVTIPPQSLIQILLGEARGQLDEEASLENDKVKSSSVSVTGDAVAAVIRNRIDLINEEGKPSLFLVSSVAYESDPPVSYYDAVIEANNGFIYQFSPADPEDPSHPVYLAAAHREDLDESLLVACDQAVLTAAAIFNAVTIDPTDGAFAFYSPTVAQDDLLDETLENGSTTLPPGCGAADANFPALSPVQVLILNEVAPSLDDDNVPSFVFVRSRDFVEPAVIKE